MEGQGALTPCGLDGRACPGMAEGVFCEIKAPVGSPPTGKVFTVGFHRQTGLRLQFLTVSVFPDGYFTADRNNTGLSCRLCPADRNFRNSYRVLIDRQQLLGPAGITWSLVVFYSIRTIGQHGHLCPQSFLFLEYNFLPELVALQNCIPTHIQHKIVSPITWI